MGAPEDVGAVAAWGGIGDGTLGGSAAGVFCQLSHPTIYGLGAVAEVGVVGVHHPKMQVQVPLGVL